MTRKVWPWAIAIGLLAACSQSAGTPTGAPGARYHVAMNMGGDTSGGCCGAGPSTGSPACTDCGAPLPYTPRCIGCGPGSLGVGDDVTAQVAGSSLFDANEGHYRRGYGPYRAVDNDPNTQWAGSGYRRPAERLTIPLKDNVELGSISLKTGPTDGSKYMVEMSDDGKTYFNASDEPIEVPRPDPRRPNVDPRQGFERNEKYNPWDEFRYPLNVNAHGKYLRIKWLNSPGNKVARPQIFDIHLYGRPPVGGTGAGESTGNPD